MYANKILQQLNYVDRAVATFSNTLRQQFTRGYILPNAESGLSSGCMGYFGMTGIQSSYYQYSNTSVSYHRYDYRSMSNRDYRYDYYRDTTYVRRQRQRRISYLSRGYQPRPLTNYYYQPTSSWSAGRRVASFVETKPVTKK